MKTLLTAIKFPRQPHENEAHYYKAIAEWMDAVERRTLTTQVLAVIALAWLTGFTLYAMIN